MRVQELYDQVAGLGFEKSLEDEDWFYQAANRALLQVNLIRPAISSYVIDHKPMKNLLDMGFTPVLRSEELIYDAKDVKAYYFEVKGVGSVYVERYDTNENKWIIASDEIRFDNTKSFVAYSGFVKDGKRFIDGPVRLRFAGDYLYSIKCVALYQHVYSDRVEDIPAYEPYVRYDLAELTDDFLTLSDPPITDDEEYRKLQEDYDVEGGKIMLLPYSVSGCFKILYHRRPRQIENKGLAQENESIIDLDEELCSLLPVLIASYIWLEDEPDRAQYYYTLYQTRAAEISAKQRNLSPARIRSSNNW